MENVPKLSKDARIRKTRYQKIEAYRVMRQGQIGRRMYRSQAIDELLDSALANISVITETASADILARIDRLERAVFPGDFTKRSDGQ